MSPIVINDNSRAITFIFVLFIFLATLKLVNAINSLPINNWKISFTMSSSAYKVEKVSSLQSNLGEGPHWDAETQSLYYVDISKNEFSLHRYDVKENKTFSATIDGESHVSFIIPVAGTTDLFAIGIRQRVCVIQWDGKSSEAKVLRIVFEVEQSEQESTFNDGKADPTGRLYAGTIGTIGKLDVFDDIFKNTNYTCGLYRYDSNDKAVKVRDKVRLSNGLAWNEKTNKFYYIDSCDLNVKEFDYDPDTGDLSNERILTDFMDDDRRPDFLADGMTIDTEGNLYIAAFNGSKIVKINPITGNIELEIKLPSKQVTSVTFGGENLDVLYVTTARLNILGPVGEDDGYLYKVTGLGVKGLDGVKVVI